MILREMTATESRVLRLGFLVAVDRMPYYAHALFAVQAVAAEGLGTFAVDRRWRLYVDPALLVGAQQWTPAVIGAVLLHEIGHLLREHGERAEVLAHPVNHTAWNLAADAEINDDLLDAGVGLPDGCITPESLGCAPGGIAEDYYAAIVEDTAADDDPGCGSGAGSGTIDGEIDSSPADDGFPSGLDSTAAAVRRRLVAKEVISRPGSGAGRGDAPAGVRRWAAQVLAPPVVPWSRVLSASVRRAVEDRAGRVNYSYRRPSRRRVPGLILPGMVEPKLAVSVVVDTSGSMSEDDLSAAMSETCGVLRSVGVQSIRFVTCDAATTVPVDVADPRRVELIGGGGTDMRVGIEAVEAARPAPDVVIVMTDGDTPWPDRPIRAALVCVVIGGHRSGPEWARTVFVPAVPARESAA